MGVIQKQGIQSAIITYLGIFAGFVSLLIVQPYFLSPEEIGLTRVLYSFSFLVSTFIPLGFINITTRFFPKFRNADKQHHGFAGLLFRWTSLGTASILLILWILKSFFQDLYIDESPLFSTWFFLVFPLSAIIAWIAVLNNYLFSLFLPIVPSFLQEVFVRAAFIVLILCYALFDWSVEWLAWGFAGTYFLQLLLVLAYTMWKGNPGLKIDRNLYTPQLQRDMIQYGSLVFAAGIASMAIKLLDSVVIGQFLPLELVGIYSIAAYIPIFIEAPVNALDKVANARIAYSWEKGDLKNIRLIYFQSARVLFVAGGILFLGVTLNADAAFTWLPAVYAKGIPILEILSLSALFNLMTGSNTAIIFTSERFRSGAYALVGVALVNLILLYTLIPVWGLEGAAWATCLASLLYNAFKYAFIWYRFGMQPFDLKTVWIALSIACTYLIVKSIPIPNDAIPAILIRSTAIIALYSLFLWASGVWNELRTLLKSGLSGRNAAQ